MFLNYKLYEIQPQMIINKKNITKKLSYMQI